MPDYDQSNSECFVLTFKEGLLSKIAHDLKISVTRFRVSIDPTGPSVVARFDPGSLVVTAVMSQGAEDANGLSAADKDKIAEQIAGDVLHASRHPQIEFRSSSVSPLPGGGYDIRGALSLHGVTREVTTVTRLQGERQVVDLELHQPDFGITPFKAMMGTLKVKPHVRIQLSVPKA